MNCKMETSACRCPGGNRWVSECDLFNQSKRTEIDNVNHPSHYKTGGIETLDYIKAKLSPDQWQGYLTGNILKYISRYPHKNGKEDCEKARFYLDKLIESMEG